jgi:hypothetical protein
MANSTPHACAPATYLRSERGRLSGLTVHLYRCQCGEILRRLLHPTSLRMPGLAV